MTKPFDGKMAGIFKVLNAQNIGQYFPNQYIMVDPDTEVLYTYIGTISSGGICPLYNKDGSLRTIKDWKKEHPDM